MITITETYTYYFSNNVHATLWEKTKIDNAAVRPSHELRFLCSIPSGLGPPTRPSTPAEVSKSFLSVATKNEITFFLEKGREREAQSSLKRYIYGI